MPNNGEFISAPSPFTDHKESVRVATVADVVLINMPAIIDGVTMGYGDRILVKDQNDPTQNNIYIYLGAGEVAEVTVGGFGGQLSSGALVTIEEGTVNADKIFMLTTDGQITFGETPLTFEETGGGVGGGGGGGVQLSDNNVWTGTNQFEEDVALQTAKIGVVAGGDTNVVLRSQVSGDGDYRYVQRANGTLEWGDGTNPADVALKRDSAGILRMSTGTNFHVGAANDFYIYGPSASIRMGMGTSHLQIDALDNFGALPWARIKRDADSNYRMLLESDGKIQWGDGTSAPDATLERGFTSGLRFTADQLQLFDRGGALFQGMVIRSTTSGQNALNLQATGDSNPRFLMNIDGDMSWGDGNVAPDTNLYRLGAGALQTDGDITAQDGDFLAKQSGDAFARATLSSDGSLYLGDGAGTNVDLYWSNGIGGSTVTTGYDIQGRNIIADQGVDVSNWLTFNADSTAYLHTGGVGRIEMVGQMQFNPGSGNIGFQMYRAGDANSRFTVDDAGRMDWGSGSGPTDISLSRNFGTEFKMVTDALFIQHATGSGYSGISQQGNNSTDVAISLTTVGEANPRFIQSLDGKAQWGDGTAAVDTNLYRNGVGQLKTDTDFRVEGTTYIDGELAHNGLTAGFYNAAPVAQAAAITDATGGIVIDTEARAALNTLLQVVRDLGLIA